MEEEQQRDPPPPAEDWCFVCKDGGDLLLCDDHNKIDENQCGAYKMDDPFKKTKFCRNCPKVYHPECVGNDGDSASEFQESWTCDFHFCSVCKGTSELHCFCCPESFCSGCIKFAKFVQLRENKGLCRECWDLVLLAEKFPSINIKNAESIDFEDRDTYECLFKEYWEIVKEKEGLNRGKLVVAKSFLDNKRKMKASRRTAIDKDLRPASSEDDSDEHYKVRKKLKKSKALSFMGWGSKPLIEFLTSIGIDASKQISQYDVSSIILKYIQQGDLIHPTKKKRFICDKKLHVIFRKNLVSIKQIDDLLKSHFFENQQNIGNKRCLEGRNTAAENKQQKTLSFEKKGYSASVVADNIKLVYLRRSLVEDLLKQPESFEDKVVGCFIKVIKTDSRECSMEKNSQQLLQVIGVKKTSSTDELDGRNVLLNSCMLADIQISMLSDSDVTEEDCEDLREKIAKGLLQRPTFEEIEKKARVLHQDIKKRWIERELVNLQNRIDHANEKGRRIEVYRLIEQREKLKKPTEQERLLKQLPTIITDFVEPMPNSSDSLSE